MSIFGCLLQGSNCSADEKAFLGVGLGKEITVDIVPLHLLGQFLPDFSLLVTDEFARFNLQDKTEEVLRLEAALDKLDGIYGKTARFRCSDFMDSSQYGDVLERLKTVIEGSEELRSLAAKTIPPLARWKMPEIDLAYPINEAACVAYLYSEGFRLKTGPETERKYDKLMRVLNENGKYGFRGFLDEMEFAYTLPAFSLSGRPVVPYIARERSDRILLDDADEDVFRKCSAAGEKTLRYLGAVGMAAAGALGKEYDMQEILASDGEGLAILVPEILTRNITRPYRRGFL